MDILSICPHSIRFTKHHACQHTVFDTHVWVWSAAGDPRAERIRVFSGTAITLGVPLITADEKIIRWNEMQRLVQVIAL